MGSGTVDRGQTGTPWTLWAAAAGGVIAGAAVPAAVAIVSFASVALHRPLLARAVRAGTAASSARLTIAWALGLAVIAAVQAAGAVLGMGAITSLGGMAARTGFGLAVEALLLAATVAYLKAPSQRLG